MRLHKDFLLIALAGAVTVLMFTGPALARNISLLNGERGFRITWTELTWVREVRCRVTLEGTWHGRSLAKTVSALVGYVTRATIQSEACTGGRATVLSRTLPWHMRYSSFTGTLPNITVLTFGIIGMGIGLHINSSGLDCLMLSEEAEPLFLGFTVGTVAGALRELTGVAPSEAGVTLTGELGFCELWTAEMGSFTREVTVLSGTVTVKVQLI
ncbi:MAG TPA: hypothetical protein VF250_10370 [Conexibacter sp.]